MVQFKLVCVFQCTGTVGYRVFRRGATFLVHSKKGTMNAVTSLVRKKILKTYREWHIWSIHQNCKHTNLLAHIFQRVFWLRQLHNFKQRWENFWTARKLYFCIILNPQMSCQNKRKCTLQKSMYLMNLGLKRKKTFKINLML